MSKNRARLTTYPGWSSKPVKTNTFESWRIGQKLTYVLLAEANLRFYVDIPKDMPTFLELMNNAGQYIVDEESLTKDDTQRIFDIIVKENNSNYMKKVLNNTILPNSSYDGQIAIKSFKQAIRLNSINVVKFMIREHVTILSNDMKSFDDIKSLIFNVLRSAEKHTETESYNITNKVWLYLAKCFYELYKNNNNAWNEQKMDTNDSQTMTIRYCKFFIKNPLIQYAIFKKVHASSTGKHYINGLLPMLHFICEHFMTFEDSNNLKDLCTECTNDKVFDCDGMIQFNTKIFKLFWSEYLTVKLIKDYLGINVLSKYRKMNESERNKILDTIQYLVANGVGKNLDNIVMPILCSEAYAKSKDMRHVLTAIEYGKNIWNVKILQKNEMLSLFADCCNKQIQIPYSLCYEILSFVVL